MKLEYYSIKTPLISPETSIFDVFIKKTAQLVENEIIPNIKDGDIIGIASKIVAMEQNRIIDLKTINPSEKAFQLAEKSSLIPEFVEIVLNEADEVIGTVTGALLTLRKGDLQANAGVDKSNAGIDKAILLPSNPSEYALKFKNKIESHYSVKNIGIIIIDSCTRPLRRGTLGMALGTAGFPAVVDERGLNDLFGYKMTITTRALADNLSSACNILMGESDESIPFVLLRGLKELISKSNWEREENYKIDMRIERENCLFFKNFTTKRF